MALEQHLYQKQLLKLTPQQLLLQRLLPLSTIALEEKIKNEIEENPALEEMPEEENMDIQDTNNDDSNSLIDKDFWQDDGDDDIADYTPELGNIQPFETKIEKSPLDILEEQLYTLNLNPQDQKIARHLIGSLDAHGYLTRAITAIKDDLLFKYNQEIGEKNILSVLQKIQQLEPVGIGARNLQECLLLQLKKQQIEGYQVEKAILVIEKYFDYLSTKNYHKLSQLLQVDMPTLQMIIEQIENLHPYPFNHSSLEYKTAIYPDFIITQKNGDIESYPVNSYVPQLRINNYYAKTLEYYKSKKQKDAESFIKQKIEQAQFFIDAIAQRKQVLQHILDTIVALQKSYLLSGDESQLQPMLLKDIAQKIEINITTMSRAIQQKYVQTDWGIKPLKYFFNEQIHNQSGDSFMSIEIENLLQKIIEQEAKQNPYTDEQLEKELLKLGKKIPRRSIANYRQKMNIPTARLRKKL